MARRSTTTRECSFCGKHESAVGKLVQGPDDLAVCDECVHLMAEVVADAPPAPSEEQSCRLVIDDGSTHEIAHGLREAVSMMGRDDSALVPFTLADGGRLAIRRERVREFVADPT